MSQELNNQNNLINQNHKILNMIDKGHQSESQDIQHDRQRQNIVLTPDFAESSLGANVLDTS